MERRLTAILAADVVGYSRLMGEDEVGTLARLKNCRRGVVDPAIEEFHGRIIKLMGDGALVEFASIVDAVQCAAAIQRKMAAHDKDTAEAQQIRFRIGVNLGDVIVDRDEIASLVLGHTLQGQLEPGRQPAILQIARDGTAGFRTMTRMLTETVYVERDLLCEQSENMFGRPDCGPVYKRRDAADNGYTFVNSSKVFHFTVK